MVNVNKLKGKIVEKEKTIDLVAEAIGIDGSTLYRKLQGNGDKITIKEADGIATYLALNPSEATAIFLASMSRKCDNTSLYRG